MNLCVLAMDKRSSQNSNLIDQFNEQNPGQFNQNIFQYIIYIQSYNHGQFKEL